MSGWERKKRKVLRRYLKTTSDCADVMWNGRSFHMLAPATGNARLPTVERLRYTSYGTATLFWQ